MIHLGEIKRQEKNNLKRVFVIHVVLEGRDEEMVIVKIVYK